MKDRLDKRGAILPILSTVVLLVYIYPEVAKVIAGESIGNDISILAFGALVLTLIFGVELLSWAEESGRLNQDQGKFVLSSLIGIVIIGSLILLYYIPDTPEAIGLLIVTALAALLILRDTISGVESSK